VIVAVTERRFPPPWSVEELDACFVIKDQAGQKLAFVYFEEEPGPRSAAKLLTKDEARRVAVNLAKLPQLVRGGPPKSPTPEQRGDENWLAQKEAEGAAGQRWTLLGWAVAGALAGAVIVGAIAIELAK
jgi:hypothetical protein